MITNKKRNIKSPLVAFTEPPVASFSDYSELGIPAGQYSTPDDNSNASGNNAVGILDSIFGGLSDVLGAGTNLIGSWFGRRTDVVDTNQKSEISTSVLLIGAVLIVILIIFLMKKQ